MEADMKFAVAGAGWPVGATLIPASTVVDTSLAQWAFLLSWPLAGKPPPPDAIALDQPTYNQMVAFHGSHRVLYGPGITPATS
jgi:hypothetical protein